MEFFHSVGPLRGLKGSVYEGGIREPLIVRWPGRIRPNSTSDLVSAHYDALATLIDVAGLPPSTDTDGISYLPTLLGRDDQQKQHEYLFWDFAGYGAQLAVRLGKWKGVRRNLRRDPDAPLELYDLDADIGETTNVADVHPDITEKISRIMVDAREAGSRTVSVWCLPRMRIASGRGESVQREGNCDGCVVIQPDERATFQPANCGSVGGARGARPGGKQPSATGPGQAVFER